MSENKIILRRPNLIVFIGSFCLMVIELVAGRIMAPYLGVSLYTWTSIIGVILLGITIGNYLGGRVADKYYSKSLLGGVFILSAALSYLVIIFAPIFGQFTNQLPLPLVSLTLFFSLIIFFPPSLFLSFITPLVVKADLRSLEKTGNTVGRIYAFSAMGSIVGTFATGFIFISLFGTKLIIVAVSIVLFVTGLSLLESKKKFFRNKLSFLVGIIFAGGFFINGPCDRESNYYCIILQPIAADNQEAGYILRLDSLVHSYVFPSNPYILTYNYERIFALAAEYVDAERNDFNTLFIGGGGYTLPRYLEAKYQAVDILVSEIDPEVTRVNYEWLGLDDNTRIETKNVDARRLLDTLPAEQNFSIIFGDAFNDFSIPYHLVTREFNDKIKSRLTDNGLYVVNLIDDFRHGNFLSSYIHTLKQTFEYVYLLPGTSNVEIGEGRNTFVIIASAKPLDDSRWQQASLDDVIADQVADDSTIHYYLSARDLENFLTNKKKILLEDNYVPVDNLLAPVVNTRVEGRSWF